MKNFFIFLFVSVLVVQKINSQDKDPKKWTPEDIINTEYMRSVSISKNGNMVLWTKSKGVKKLDKFVSDIYLTRLDIPEKNGFKTIQLTFGESNDHSPFFSKDEKDVYFLSTRDKGKKLWKLSLYGGEAKEVHEFKNGISGVQWLSDHKLIFRSNEGETLYEKLKKETKDNVVVVEDSLHWKPSRVYSFDLTSKKMVRLTDNEKPIGTYAVSPNGEWLIYSTQRSRSYAADAQKDPFYFLKNLKTGKVEQIINDRGFPSGSFQFTSDNKGFYFTSTTASNPEWNGAGISELYYFDIAALKYRKVDLKWELGLGRGYVVSGNDVVATLANRANYTLTYYKKNNNSWSKKVIKMGAKNGHSTVIGTSKNGSFIAYQYSTASRLPTFHIAKVNAGSFENEMEIVKLNKKLSKKPITKSEVLEWNGYKNEKVTGILYYPENYEQGKRYPLILSIHGGPAGVDTDTWSERWSTYPNILSQRGAFVLKPNYHGSSNHGLSFVESIKQNYYEPEMEDIIKAIDLLDQKGMIDKSMLGTMGWSNGAIITTMLTVRYPDLFKVAAPGAGDVNWTSDYGTCRFGVSFDQSYFGGAPWDDVDGKFYNENYIIKSPLFEIEKIKTPTIIFHGSEDRAVPRDQGWEYYRGLQQVGKTPVRFLWFPGQPHGLGKITHQLRKMKEELKWIDTYLFGKNTSENETIKKGSPIASLLKLEKAGITKNGNYGVIHNGKLIPETVQIKEDSIGIGRFEVTNAQFKAFDEDHSFNAGLDNYPAVVSKQQAENYVNWLSTITDEKYRLPNLAEAKKLHATAVKSAPNQNTLNKWAGYAITIDEIAEFREKTDKLNATLLKKVGKYNAVKVGNAEVYDLGGNVAEYYDAGIYDYSAYDFFDAMNSSMIQSGTVGIRVIKD